MIDRSLSQQLQDLDKGEYSSVELTQTYLDRIENHQSLNAFVSISEDVLEKARQADQLRASGLYQDVRAADMTEIDLSAPSAVLLNDGDY
jgi:aspartyl-tRNA(Asn)/glutamyl-tRNA(Gln) amidotransferase subunit A